jgi:hypothetical protein
MMAAFKGDLRMHFEKDKNRSKNTSIPKRLCNSPVTNKNKTVKGYRFYSHFRPLYPLSHDAMLQVVDDSIYAAATEDKNRSSHENNEYVCGCGCECCFGCGHDL